MIEHLLRERVLGLLVGLVLAGFVAIAGALAGLPSPYPVVLGVAIYVPIAAMAGADTRFDLDAYLDARSERGVLIDVATIASAGAIGGAVVTELALGWGARGLLLLGGAIFGTFLGGQLVFFARTWRHHRPWREPGTDTT